jgi:AraC-like DNA-binding protein
VKGSTADITDVMLPAHAQRVRTRVAGRPPAPHGRMTPVPAARHLLRARDHADRHYAEPIGVGELAAAAGLSRAHFSREFSRTFGESPRWELRGRER